MLAVHHLTLSEKLNTPTAFPAETPPHHDLLGVFHGHLGELWAELVQPRRPSAATRIFPRLQLKVAFIGEHGSFPLFHSPASVSPGKLEPLLSVILWLRRLGGHLHGGHLQLVLARLLNPPETYSRQGRHLFL